MALQAALSLNVSACVAGQTPPPMATLTVYNPNASAVTVTGIQITARAVGDNAINHTAMAPSLPPVGPNQNTTIAAASSQTFGPFPVAIGSAANANSFQAVNPSGSVIPTNPQGSQPPQTTFMIGGMVAGSDGSSNVICEAGLFVSYSTPPPLGFQGGFLNLAGPNNLANLVVIGGA